MSIQELLKYSHGDYVRNFVYANDLIEVYLDMLPYEGAYRPFIHIQMLGSEMAREQYEDMLVKFDDIMEALSVKEVPSIYAVIAHSEMNRKFAEMFGFSIIQFIHDKEDSSNVVGYVMERKVM